MKDLITVAHMNPRFTDIILDHYIGTKFRMHEELITIRITWRHSLLYYDSVEHGRVYVTQDSNQTRWVLEHFGRVFNHLRYEIDEFGMPNSQKIFECVEKMYPKVEKPITIGIVDHEALANWTYSFDSTTTTVELGSSASGPLPLRTLFPYMQELNTPGILKSTVDHHPHLTKLLINSMINIDDTAFEFIRLNPQLRHFETWGTYNESFVSYLNEMAPNLESLGFRVLYSPTVPQIVRFKNVKEFSIDIRTAAQYPHLGMSIENMEFDQLEKLKIITVPTPHYYYLVDMILENHGLRVIETNLDFIRDEIIKLLQELPDLEEISLYWYSRAQFSTVGALELLFASNQRLNKITVRGCDRASVVVLKELNPLNWELLRLEDQIRSDVSFIRT